MSKLFIAAGHGGKDPGAVSGNLLEKDFTLKIANKLAALLKADGFEILQDRTTDVDNSINDRVKKANDEKVSAFVEIHLNAGGGTGCEVYHSYIGGTGKILAENISKRIAELGYRNRGAKVKLGSNNRDFFGVIRMTNMPSVLVECCFLDSAQDMQQLNIDTMAAAIRKGVLEVYPAPEKSKPEPTPAPTPAPVPTPAPDFKIGDIVTFKGGHHYTTSNAGRSVGGVRKAGKAKITNINLKGRHQYHLVGIGSCNVYGWVNRTLVK